MPGILIIHTHVDEPVAFLLPPHVMIVFVPADQEDSRLPQLPPADQEGPGVLPLPPRGPRSPGVGAIYRLHVDATYDDGVYFDGARMYADLRGEGITAALRERDVIVHVLPRAHTLLRHRIQLKQGPILQQ